VRLYEITVSFLQGKSELWINKPQGRTVTMIFSSFEVRRYFVKKSKLPIVGIISGLLCALCVFAFTQSVFGEAEAARAEALTRYGGEQLEVCVAKRDIAPGEKVDSSNTTTQLWVVDLLPQECVKNISDVSGQQATSAIYAGEVITTKRFVSSSTSLEIPDGLSALSVHAKDVQTIGGLVSAGMRVDVYAVGSSSTSLLVKNVLVVSTNITDSDTSSSSSITWVTLAIEPKSVQEMITASQLMDLYFVLPGETSEVKETGDE
jgi:pilus assembly protein CpaB